MSFTKQSSPQFIKSFENSRQMWPNMLFVFRIWHGIVIMFNKIFDTMLEIYWYKLGKNVITFSIQIRYPEVMKLEIFKLWNCPILGKNTIGIQGISPWEPT
jgi:hypothetical protein